MLQRLAPQEIVTASLASQIKLFADGASLADFTRLNEQGDAAGFTTNPTLMRRAQITDYEAFAHELIARIPDKHISFEVFSDEFEDMARQARKIATWGENVYVKIPITNTRRESSLPMVRELAAEGVKLNVTAILTLEQVAETVDALHADVPAVISVFAGRIADTGVDPMPVMRAAVAMAARRPKAEVLWASVREVLNIYQARDCGCHIITSTPDVLKKLSMAGKDLADLSQETVAMFYDDAVAAGFQL
ncbi:transaldolase [Caulobacter hibisci]|uniref:Transaldolase n=1 Tax=Caulobacter hibisci TaxID=2035993 RepID=A0ABS0ST26_9CAUL|nr:transaldolase [Caulobacter hibisci]MBI1682820.1 transaldolase [Caulobacter hibisci]